MVVGAALLLGVLGASLGEYQYAVPQFALAYYPPILGAMVGGVLLFGARAAGRRWAATAICLVYLGIQLLAELELGLVGMHRSPALALVPLAGLLVDLLWSRLGQSAGRSRRRSSAGWPRSPPRVDTDAPTSECLVAPTPGARSAGRIAPAAVLTGALAGVVGARAGYSLRPTPRESTRLGAPVRRLGLPLLALVLAFAALGGPPRQHDEPARAKVVLGQQEIVAGQPPAVRVEVAPADALAG